MNIVLDFSVVFERWPELLRGTLATLGLALAGMTLALVIGVLGVAIRRSGRNLPCGDRHRLRRDRSQHAVPGADLLHLLRSAAARACG